MNERTKEMKSNQLAEWLETHSSDRVVLNELMRIYIGDRNVDAMLSTLEVWLTRNPGDTEIEAALADLRQQLSQTDTAAVDSP